MSEFIPFSKKNTAANNAISTASSSSDGSVEEALYDKIFRSNYDRCLSEGMSQEDAQLEAALIASQLSSTLAGHVVAGPPTSESKNISTREGNLILPSTLPIQIGSSATTKNESKWACTSCTFENVGGAMLCEVCQMPKVVDMVASGRNGSSVPSPPSSSSSSKPSSFTLSAGASAFVPFNKLALSAVASDKDYSEFSHLPSILLVLSGLPGCGKTTFSNRLMEYSSKVQNGRRFAWICQDHLKDKKACLRAAREALGKGFNVIIDRCNHNTEQRDMWTVMAIEHEAAAICIVLPRATDTAFCIDNATKRGRDPLHADTDPSAWHGIITGFSTHYTEPVAGQESFYEVIKLNNSEEISDLIRKLAHPSLADM